MRHGVSRSWQVWVVVCAASVLGACSSGSSTDGTEEGTVAVASQLALASVLSELAASADPGVSVAASARVADKGIPGFNCSLTAPTNTCDCPGGGSFIANLSNFIPSSRGCDPSQPALQETNFQFQYEGTFANCEVQVCGQNVVVDGDVVGNLDFFGSECTSASTISGLVRTLDRCSGVQVSVGGTTLDVGTDSILFATGTFPTTTFDLDMSGSACGTGFTTSFSSLEDLGARLDPTGACGLPGGPSGNCATFNQNNVDFRECSFDAATQECRFYIQFDGNTDVERTCGDHCEDLGGACLRSEEEADNANAAGQCLGSGFVSNCLEDYNSAICICLLSPTTNPTDCANVVPGDGGFGAPCRNDGDCLDGLPCCVSTDVSEACGTQVGLCECI